MKLRPVITSLAAIVALAIGAAACGNSQTTEPETTTEGVPPGSVVPTTEATPTESGTEATTGEETAASDTGATADGEAIFAANCGSCHTLAAAGTDAAVGPNLDETDADEQSVVDQVTNGGGGMPAFGGQLSEQEIQAVAKYVVESRG